MTAAAATETRGPLARLFDVERVDDLVWQGRSDVMTLPHVFGGQLVGQSLMAAARSIESPHAQVHSIHTIFLRPGVCPDPVRYEVEDTYTGNSRVSRQVTGLQDGRVVCRSFVSASAEGDGIAHSRPAPAAGPVHAARPLELVAAADGGLGPWWADFDAVEVRVAPLDEQGSAPHSAIAPRNFWMRAVERLPDDPAMHRAAVAFASDLMLMGVAVAAHGVPTGFERTLAKEWWGISLDHTIWFHDAVAGDEWVVYEHTTPMAHASRALIQAAAFDEAGRPVCHVAQEALVRRHRTPGTGER
ncbi:MAG: acyl-CoA thioesterase [Jatrophihabitans sp.]|uniref:acyl-CoA thioesterase n=1 Tax=Jatrophihabitans sp. TaxID=1932789 RepID=UPI003F7DB5B9